MVVKLKIKSEIKNRKIINSMIESLNVRINCINKFQHLKNLQNKNYFKKYIISKYLIWIAWDRYFISNSTKRKQQ